VGRKVRKFADDLRNIKVAQTEAANVPQITKVLDEQVLTAQQRLALEEKIYAIQKQQAELVFQSKAKAAQAAFSGIGGSEIAGNIGMLSALNQGQDPYQQDYDRWEKLQDQKLEHLWELGKSEAQLKDQYREYEIRQEELHQQQKLALATNTFGLMGNLASAFYDASGGKNKAAFELMKAMRIGETIMNTYSAAVGAYQALAPIPIVGPALGAAAAAAAIAFGMAQVRAIASMKPGGGAVGTASARAVSAGSASTGSTVNTGDLDKVGQKTSPVINVHIYGNVVDHDAFARELVPAILKAQDDGVGG
jgi:hypothetical protein